MKLKGHSKVSRHFRRLLAELVFVLCFLSQSVWAEQRFPPPDFESGYKLRETSVPAARALAFQYLDVFVLAAALGLALWLIYAKRSRRGIYWLSLFSLAYFGFYKQGCICSIGSGQNLALALFDHSYFIPLTVLAFFVLPIMVALLAGRAFCAAVCPHGAIQDLVLVKPHKVPAWLEHGLGILPYLVMGAAGIYAAASTTFLVCRYDPFVPLFRRSGSLPMVTAGVAFLVLGMFVGRPYCRFLCPYGALLRIASLFGKWRVRVTPDRCTQCRLCENSCPFGAMREPSANSIDPQLITLERRRLSWLLLALIGLIAGGAWLGLRLSVAASHLHPTVQLAERYLRQKQKPVPYGLQTPEALSLQRADKNPEELLVLAVSLRHRFRIAGWLFGAWAGLVVGVKLIAVSVRPSRSDFEPDRGACFACGRCFEYCPEHRALGL